MDDNKNVIISVFKNEEQEKRVDQFSILFAELINDIEENRKNEISVS